MATETVERNKAIDLLRSALLERIDDDKSACREAAEKGIFCGGFARFTDPELRQRYSWITRRHPKMTRDELEEIADRWQLARQEVSELPIACDVQMREHDLCNGWNDFSNEQIAEFLYELTGEKVIVS
jgi:hypothetical protein